MNNFGMKLIFFVDKHQSFLQVDTITFLESVRNAQIANHIEEFLG